MLNYSQNHTEGDICMKIAICDDEKEQQACLAAYCKKYNPSLSVSIFSAAVDLLLAFERDSYDIVFMDIEMPSPNGFEVAKMLRKRSNPPLVIFVTKSNSYTIQGYGIAFRYLAKPVSYEPLASVLALAIKEREPSKISFVCEGMCHVLVVKEIIYCETLDHNLTLYTKDACYSSRTPLTELMSQLPSEDFTQPHKSYLVNLNYVQSVGTNSVCLVSDGTKFQVPLSKGKRKHFIQRLGEYIGR